MSGRVIGRFAPTPSGFLHPGNLLCAMIAYLSVRAQGGQCLLRIEDLDTARCPRHLVRQTLEDLDFLGFRWDGPVLYQSSRSEVYKRAFHRLEMQGLVYPCFCSRAQLHAVDLAPNRGDTVFLYPGTCRNLTPEETEARRSQKAPAWRLRVPSRQIAFTDRHMGRYEADPAETLGDFILRRADNVYAYNLAVVVDDAETGVTEVVRGSDILSSTPSQIFLQDMLGLPVPDYAHLPLLVDAEGRRLAKRNQAVSLTSLAKQYTAEEILGNLAAAAHLIPEPEPLTLEALIPRFSWNMIPQEDLRLPEGFLPAETLALHR